MTDLASLVEMMCQGTATRADRDRLESLLRDPANRSAYLAASRLHSELLWRWHRGRYEVLLTPSPNIDPGLVRESSCPWRGWKGFSDEEATQCRADRGLASAG